jgi:pimeloyl-ACP methyl ester carboxylesterase
LVRQSLLTCTTSTPAKPSRWCSRAPATTPVRNSPSGGSLITRPTFEDLSPAFRTTPLAHYFAKLFTERNELADVETIIHQFKALAAPYPEGHHERIGCPSLILTGSEDGSHQRAFALKERIPNCELKVLPGAGHACQIEQPWLFDRFVIEFLAKHGLFPGKS